MVEAALDSTKEGGLERRRERERKLMVAGVNVPRAVICCQPHWRGTVWKRGVMRKTERKGGWHGHPLFMRMIRAGA